jgi:hypothetical protein
MSIPPPYLYPDKRHDFRWENEYVLDTRATKEHVRALHSAMDDARAILPLLGVFPDFARAYVTGLGRGILGRYVDGTVSLPHIALSCRQIYATSEQYDVDVHTGLVSTIHHELGHALQESLGIDRFGADAEEQAELLAQVWFRDECVAPEWLRLLGIA